MLTDRRLIFRPNWVDSWFFAAVAIDLVEIASVGVADRTYNPNDGGLARRVRVSLRNGTEHLFVLWPHDGGAAAYASRLQACLADGSQPPAAEQTDAGDDAT